VPENIYYPPHYYKVKHIGQLGNTISVSEVQTYEEAINWIKNEVANRGDELTICPI